MNLEYLFGKYNGGDLFRNLSELVQDEEAPPYVGLKSVTVIDEGYYRLLMGMNPKSQRIFDLFAENSLEILPKSVINQDVDLVNSLGELLECGIISNNNPYYITLTERGQHMLIILLMRNALKEMAEELGEYDEPQDSSKPVKQKPEKRKNPNVMEVSFDIGNQRQY